MNSIFLSDKAEEGFRTLLADLEKLRQKNREVIPEKHLRILDRIMELMTVIGVVLLSVTIIIGVWLILTSNGLDAVTRFVGWIMDFLKLLKVVA
jgi:hypothetical protein